MHDFSVDFFWNQGEFLISLTQICYPITFYLLSDVYSSTICLGVYSKRKAVNSVEQTFLALQLKACLYLPKKNI